MPRPPADMMIETAALAKALRELLEAVQKQGYVLAEIELPSILGKVPVKIYVPKEGE